MANTDRPRGFNPVGTISGRPLMATLRTIGVTDGADMFVGDLINLASGLGAVAATNDAALLGVAVGFGKVNGEGVPLGPFNPAALTPSFYDDSASTHTEWVVYYVPVYDTVFEVQNTASSAAVGTALDLVVTNAGSQTSGRSGQEVGTSTNADFVVVGLPKLVDNDNTAANATVYVAVTNAEQAFI